MQFTVIIPARYGSTRFPGKVLVDIQGKPMVQHVYERAVESGASRVIVATDDARVATVCLVGKRCATKHLAHPVAHELWAVRLAENEQ